MAPSVCSLATPNQTHTQVFTCPHAGADYLLRCNRLSALANHVGPRTFICSTHFTPSDIVSVRAGNLGQYTLLASAVPCASPVQVNEAFITCR